MSKDVLFALVAVLSVSVWSTPAQARQSGIIGVGYQGHLGPPKIVDAACTFRVTIPCYCGADVVTNFDTADGCSINNYEEAKRNAPVSCTMLCDKARANAGNNNGNGGVAGRPGGASGGVITLTGAGTLEQRQSRDYVGHVPYLPEPIGPTWEKERLADELVERTSVPWVWLKGFGESIQWEDPRGSAAFVQAYWSARGVPKPIGHCRHSVQLACPLEDVRLGDSLQVCSAESELDAQDIARMSCAPMRYNALSRSWRTWGIYGEPADGQYSAPAATVLAVGPQQFLGYIPSSLKVVGISDDWTKLANELLERTAGTRVWLAGPAGFYAPEKE